MRDLLYSNVIA